MGRKQAKPLDAQEIERRRLNLSDRSGGKTTTFGASKAVLMQLVAMGPRDPKERQGEGPRGGESDVIVGAKPTLTSHRVKVIRRNRIEQIKEGTVDHTAEKCTYGEGNAEVCTFSNH